MAYGFVGIHSDMISSSVEFETASSNLIIPVVSSNFFHVLHPSSNLNFWFLVYDYPLRLVMSNDFSALSCVMIHPIHGL